jgi:hypothetical protein
LIFEAEAKKVKSDSELYSKLKCGVVYATAYKGCYLSESTAGGLRVEYAWNDKSGRSTAHPEQTNITSLRGRCMDACIASGYRSFALEGPANTEVGADGGGCNCGPFPHPDGKYHPPVLASEATGVGECSACKDETHSFCGQFKLAAVYDIITNTST